MTAQQFTRGPSMRDVATAAGVSAQTISRVLNDHPNVQESTRRRVLAVVDELGYRRNNTARALVTGRSKTIGVLTLATNNFSRSALTLGVELGAREAGYTVNAVTSDLSVEGLTSAVHRLVLQGVDGIVIAAPLQEAATQVSKLTQRIPTINTDGSTSLGERMVGVDQDIAAALATQHLSALGHKTVWHVAGPQESSDALARRNSWRRAACRKRGVRCPPNWKAIGARNPAIAMASSWAAWPRSRPFLSRAMRWRSACSGRWPS
ncbi:LacI family DNA-binding transcriptional regulator [Arthrobacter psychrolactophilus]